MKPIVLDSYKGQLVGLLGLGLTGVATARAFLAGGAKVIGWDDGKQTRKNALTQLPQLELLPPEAAQWSAVDLFVPSPGIDEKHELIKSLTFLKKNITGDVELFYQAVKGTGAKIIAITGTNGKSTTTARIAHLLQSAGLNAQVGGNIGVPLFDLSPPTKDNIYVLEISSYQALRLQDFAPTIAIQLNLTPDHTGRHGSMKNYAAAKAKIFAHLGRQGLALINSSDAFGKKLYQEVKAKKVDINKASLPKGFPADLKRGEPKENLVAVHRVARAFGIKDEVFVRAMSSFTPLPHRQEVIAEIKGVRFINDSKATNADAVKPALARHHDVHWLVGGAAKQEGFDALAKSLSKVKHAYLFGAAKEKLAHFLQKKVSFSQYETLEAATEAAVKKAKKGVVLLSPACASFDAYRDFEERGRAFGRTLRASQSPKVVMAAGGTGGGLFPAEALAERLRAQGKAVYLFHDKRAAAYLPPEQVSGWDGLKKVASAPMAARTWLGVLGASFFMAIGVVQSLYFLLRLKGKKVIVGFGGYPSVPVLLAGWLLRIPLVLHEPGSTLGRANKMLLPFAKKLSLSFPLTKTSPKTVLTGNPVRGQIRRWQGFPYSLPRGKKEPLRVLIFAGSQGAAWFDKNLAPALIEFARRYKKKIFIVQQCREGQAIEKLYTKAGIEHRLAPFFSHIESFIAQSHLVIARAGASTVSELSLLARPAILIPIRDRGAYQEQKTNADNFAKTGLGQQLDEQDFTAASLAKKINNLIGERVKLERTVAKFQKQKPEDAGDKLANLVLKEGNV